MMVLGDLGVWIASNESLLSGIAAIIVVTGVIFTPIGAGLRRVLRADGGGVEDEPEVEREITFAELTQQGPYETRFAASDGLRIAYNTRGEGPPDLLFSPGAISHLHIIDHLPHSRRALARLQQFARVVVFDKRGQGLSDPTPDAPDLEVRSRDIEAVMNAAGLDQAILMGISESGPMCIHFATTRPDRVRGLILAGTTPRWTQGRDFPQGIPRESLERLPKLWGRGTLRDMFFPGVTREILSDETYRAVEKIIAGPQGMAHIFNAMIDYDVRDLLPQIDTPTLVVHFSGDLAVPIRLGRLLAEQIPHAEFLEMNAVDHADFARSPEAMDRIEEFCRRVGVAGVSDGQAG
jgi:pimeloyl-ACP methyl ester carboxylesterase